MGVNTGLARADVAPIVASQQRALAGSVLQYGKGGRSKAWRKRWRKGRRGRAILVDRAACCMALDTIAPANSTASIRKFKAYQRTLLYWQDNCTVPVHDKPAFGVQYLQPFPRLLACMRASSCSQAPGVASAPPPARLLPRLPIGWHLPVVPVAEQTATALKGFSTCDVRHVRNAASSTSRWGPFRMSPVACRWRASYGDDHRTAPNIEE